MTVTPGDLALYAGALFILFATPGPVWLALIARSVSGGFAAAWPLALGVVVGDAFWPLLAILGVSWLVQEAEGAMTVLRLVASAIFVVMGANLIRHRHREISAARALTRPGRWAGFLAGVAVILGNPKAILFYMGVLPGFFDLTRLTGADIAAIVGLSLIVPLVGNLVFALFIDRIRAAVTAPGTQARMTLAAGVLLIAVGIAIPFT